MTRLVHGEEGLARALRITEHALPGQETGALTVDSIREMHGHVPTSKLDRQEVVGLRVCDVLAICNFSSSRAEARRLIKNGGVRVGDRKIADELDIIRDEDLIEGRYVVFSLGKKIVRFWRFVDAKFLTFLMEKRKGIRMGGRENFFDFKGPSGIHFYGRRRVDRQEIGWSIFLFWDCEESLSSISKPWKHGAILWNKH